MKKCIYFLGLLATAIAFNACSDNDDVAADSGGNGIVDGMAYMQVTISQPTGGATRAAADSGYVYGTGEEYKVSSAKFLFFNADGSYLTEGKEVKNATQSPNGEEHKNIESYVSTTVVLGPTTIKPNTNIKMLTFLNFQDDASGTKWTDLKGKTLDEVLNMTDNASNRASGSYVMTTSAYVDGKGVVQATEVPADSFKTSESAAKGGGVPVYVERTVAKVGMAVTSSTASSIGEVAYNKPYVDNKNYYFLMQDANGSSAETATFTLDGENVNLAVKITGWRANAVNTKGYIVKHISNSQYGYIDCENSTPKDTTSAGINATKPWSINSDNNSSNSSYYWNDSTDFRSFWAEDVNYASGAEKISTVTGDGFAKTEAADTLAYYSINSVGTNQASEYVYENTIDQRVAKFRGKDDANVTTMLVVGKIGVWDKSKTSTGEAFTDKGDLYRVAGAFYTETAFKKLLVSELNKTYCTLDNSTEKDLTADDLNIGTLNPTAVTTGTSLDKISYVSFSVSAAEGKTLYKRNTSSNGTNDQVSGSIPVTEILSGPISYYKDGTCFYQVPIEHPVYGNPAVTSAPNDATIYGVVRNHSYQLTLNSVGKLGNPVNDPDEPITPIPGDDTYYYLGTKLNVLAWRKATQEVNL